MARTVDRDHRGTLVDAVADSFIAAGSGLLRGFALDVGADRVAQRAAFDALVRRLDR